MLAQRSCGPGRRRLPSVLTLALLLSPCVSTFAATDTGDADPAPPPREAQPPAASTATAKPETADTPSPGNAATLVTPAASKRAPAATGLCDGS